MELTRKRFEEIAGIIKKSFRDIEEELKKYPPSLTTESANRIFCNNFASWLSTENPRFNKDKFMNACMVKD